MIRALGFVQVDSINTVARAHHMILFARNQTYRMRQLTHLLERERSLFEHWTHDASVIPTEFFPYWRHRFERDRIKLLHRWR
ncbi:MAG: crosslink repair DNA glycosylase YcaQ family protein, partial [Alphaproteobacteria bacterium]